MPKTTTTRTGRDDYLTRVRAFPLRRIGSESEHSAALGVSGSLVGLERKLTPGEGAYLDALVVLIREYEQRGGKPPPRRTSAVGVLKHLMAEHRLSQKGLAQLLGVGESAVSMILAGERELTKSHIATLSREFGVGPSAFF